MEKADPGTIPVSPELSTNPPLSVGAVAILLSSLLVIKGPVIFAHEVEGSSLGNFKSWVKPANGLSEAIAV